MTGLVAALTTVSSVDGFCAALVAGPERTATEAWLRVIFGPSLPTTPVGLGAVQAVLEHHNAVSHMLRLDGGRWRLLNMRDEDGIVSVSPWAAGFMFAVRRWPEAWQPLLEHSNHSVLMLPIITCAEAEEVYMLLEGQPQAMRDHMGRT